MAESYTPHQAQKIKRRIDFDVQACRDVIDRLMNRVEFYDDTEHIVEQLQEGLLGVRDLSNELKDIVDKRTRKLSPITLKKRKQREALRRKEEKKL